MWVIFHVSRVQYLKCLIGLLHHKAVYFKIQAHPPLCFGMSLLLSSWRQAHQWWTVSASTPCACVSSFWARNEHVWKKPGRESPSSSLPCHLDLWTKTTTTKVINNNQNSMCTMQRYNFCRYTELQPNCHPRTCCCYWGRGKGMSLWLKEGGGRGAGQGEEEAEPCLWQECSSWESHFSPSARSRWTAGTGRGECCSWPLPATAGQLGLSSGETMSCMVILSFDFFLFFIFLVKEDISKECIANIPTISLSCYCILHSCSTSEIWSIY